MNINEITDPALITAARLLTTAPPPVDATQARAVLRSQYGLSGTVNKLIGERDQNFLVELTSGGRRVLKFYNDVDDAATRAFQHGALIHMQNADISCSIPRLIKTQDGSEECAVETADGRKQGILITFVPGVASQLATVTPELRYNIGCVAAQIARALDGFTHPAAQRILLWDHMQLEKLSGFTTSITDAARRLWLERFIAHFATKVKPHALGLPSQIIHNDMSGSNVFVDPDDTSRITGVIDFGDMVYGPRISEIAVTAGYFISEDENPMIALTDVLRGYEKTHPLFEEEVAILPDLFRARLAIRVLIYQWRSELFPENRDYILRHSNSAWRLIDWFIRHDVNIHTQSMLAEWREWRRT